MDMTNLPLVLGGIGGVFGAYATWQQQRSANMNKRFEMLFGFQGESIVELKHERDDFRERLTASEKQHYATSLDLLNCEKARHATEMKVVDLTHTVEELKQMVSHGDS